MLVVHVHVLVHSDRVDEFKAASLKNAAASLKEPGVARFDVVQHKEDPARFIFVEAYKTPDAPAAHKQTEHYQTWRDTVADMMAEPRYSEKYESVFPTENEW